MGLWIGGAAALFSVGYAFLYAVQCWKKKGKAENKKAAAGAGLLCLLVAGAFLMRVLCSG